MEKETIKIKVKNVSTNPLPEFKTIGSAGVDVQAFVPEGDRIIRIPAGDRALIPTGLFLELPQGYEMQVRSRSGLALKEGIMVLNSPGTVDSDYRGEVGVILFNTTDSEYHVIHGERIAQLVLKETEHFSWELVTELEETIRGEGGFGSTGK